MRTPAKSSLILASASPRRRELLAQLGLGCRCLGADIDESPLPGEAPRTYATRLALAKAHSVRQHLGNLAQPTESDLVLGADTVVTLDDQLLGKPEDAVAGALMLAQLSGRWHQVVTGVALIGQQEHVLPVVTRVLFRSITPAEAAAYWSTGEPRDKAGGYAIQGIGALFVERIEGSYSNVVGLPLFETARLLALEGVTPWSAESIVTMDGERQSGE